MIREFVKEAARSGIDVFRVFDSLNWLPGMELAMDEVLNQNKICEGTICYTGDILDPKNDKYTQKGMAPPVEEGAIPFWVYMYPCGEIRKYSCLTLRFLVK